MIPKKERPMKTNISKLIRVRFFYCPMITNLDETHLYSLKPKVRLSAREIEIIRATVHNLLENHTRIRIFGSRARLDEKGGDIDILIETEQKLSDRVATACRLTSQLQMQLGDQKIDVIIVDPVAGATENRAA